MPCSSGYERVAEGVYRYGDSFKAHHYDTAGKLHVRSFADEASAVAFRVTMIEARDKSRACVVCGASLKGKRRSTVTCGGVCASRRKPKTCGCGGPMGREATTCRRCSNPRTHTKEGLAQRLAAAADKVGRTPYIKEFRELGLPNPSLYHKYFGSLTAAWEAAGLDPRPAAPRKVWTRDSILTAITAWAQSHNGHAPSTNHAGGSSGLPSTATVSSEFGSWNRCIEAAGMAPRASGIHYHQQATAAGRRTLDRNRNMVTGGRGAQLVVHTENRTEGHIT